MGTRPAPARHPPGTRLAALVVLALAALTACGQRVAPAPAAGDTLHVPAFEWRMADPLALKAAYLHSGQVVPDGAELHGFAGVLPDGTRVIYTLPPVRVDDEATCTLGHEVMHLALGSYHQ